MKYSGIISLPRVSGIVGETDELTVIEMNKFRLISTIFMLLVLSACEPMGPMPGTKLSGTLESVPDNWQPLDVTETVQLETRVGDRYYSVNIWGIGVGEFYYVASANGIESRWAQRIEKNNQVRLRIDESLFELAAVIVTDQPEREKVAQAFKEKYDVDSSEDFPDVVVYRLESSGD